MKFDNDGPDIINAAYKGLLGRTPDPQGLKFHVDRLAQNRDLAAILRAIVQSQEFRSRLQILPIDYLAPLWAESKATINIEATPQQLDLLFERIRRGWTKLGETEPHWSVSTNDIFKAENFAKNEDQFYQSGAMAFERIERVSRRVGIEFNRSATILELGCGTGRVTHVLAAKCKRVVAVDVSPGNLRLCQEKLQKLGKTNVDYLLLKSPRDIQKIPAIDIFFSTIVLQHNPPPVIHYFLDQILGKIRPLGSAIFQVPTDTPGYSFNITDYLASSETKLEMHCLPMPSIFSLFSKHGLVPVQVQMDGFTGWLGSNTFFATRPKK